MSASSHDTCNAHVLQENEEEGRHQATSSVRPKQLHGSLSNAIAAAVSVLERVNGACIYLSSCKTNVKKRGAAWGNSYTRRREGEATRKPPSIMAAIEHPHMSAAPATSRDRALIKWPTRSTARIRTTGRYVGSASCSLPSALARCPPFVLYRLGESTCQML